MAIDLEPGDDLYKTTVDVLADPVFDGILHKGLQHHRRNRHFKGVIIYENFSALRSPCPRLRHGMYTGVTPQSEGQWCLPHERRLLQRLLRSEQVLDAGRL